MAAMYAAAVRQPVGYGDEVPQVAKFHKLSSLPCLLGMGAMPTKAFSNAP
jgi:hypothetical protein